MEETWRGGGGEKGSRCPAAPRCKGLAEISFLVPVQKLMGFFLVHGACPPGCRHSMQCL